MSYSLTVPSSHRLNVPVSHCLIAVQTHQKSMLTTNLSSCQHLTNQLAIRRPPPLPLGHAADVSAVLGYPRPRLAEDGVWGRDSTTPGRVNLVAKTLYYVHNNNNIVVAGHDGLGSFPGRAPSPYFRKFIQGYYYCSAKCFIHTVKGALN